MQKKIPYSIFHIPYSAQGGFLIVQVLVFAAVSAVILGALAFWGATSYTASRKAVIREQAFHISEAGIEYYRWHLAHNTTDYKDGTGTSGPYVHDYYDKDGTKIGQFTLTITPPPNGGTTVVISSKGSVLEDPAISRTIETTVSIASYARYAVIGGGASLTFGTGVDVTGPVLGNNGVRFNGTAHNVVYSAVDKYNDTSYSPAQNNMLGVHTDASPADPAAPVSSIPAHSDIFLAGRQFPPFFNISAIDFNAISSTLTDLQAKSLTPSGFHLNKASGNSSGYHIVLKTNGTFDVYNVGKVHTDPHCYNYSSLQPGWEMGSIDPTGETFISNNPYPANGIIFVEDNLWLDGQINNNRLTIAAGSFYNNGQGDPQSKNITINHNLTYTNYDGTDALGVIAQNNINVGLVSDDNLRIDAALISQGGRLGRFYFLPNSTNWYTCGVYASRNSIYLYGMLASYGASGFTYSNNGYQNRTIVYDSNLYYNPPPSFPLTSSQYTILKWREVQK